MDIDIYLFIEKGLRGEFSYIAKRYSKVNDRYMKNFGPKKPSKFITYLDMNSSYGWAMNVKKRWWIWCKFNQQKEYNMIDSQSWS